MTKISTKLIVMASAALMLGGCETIADTLGSDFRASLTGAQEVPGPGDPNGSGSAQVTVDAATPQICYDLSWANIETPTAAHIHRGAVGVAGPPVLPLEVESDGDEDECVSVTRELAAEILANPTGFYVNIHTPSYPDGAIRGQLRAGA